MEKSTTLRIFYSIVAVICLLLIWSIAKECNGQKQTQTIVTPEITGTLTNPDTIKHEPVTIEKTVIKWRDREVIIPAAADTVYVNKYITETDSIKRLEQFADAVTVRNYSQPFEDEHIQADVKGLVRGTVLNMTIDYKIKPQTIEVPKPRRKFVTIGPAVIMGPDLKVRAGVAVTLNVVSF